MDVLTIKKYVKEGLNNGYRQNLRLIGSFNDFVNDIREYFLTVHVAQALLRWQGLSPYKVRIEYPVLYFSMNAFSRVKVEGDSIFNSNFILRSTINKLTNRRCQKVDIAIVDERMGDINIDERSLVGIELKGINKDEFLILKDAKRLARAMCCKDQISCNSIRFSICAFLKRFDKPNELVSSQAIQDTKRMLVKHWEGRCNGLSKEFPELSFTIEMFDIIESTHEDISSSYDSIANFLEIAERTGAVSGFLLLITRNGTEYNTTD